MKITLDSVITISNPPSELIRWANKYLVTTRPTVSRWEGRIFRSEEIVPFYSYRRDKDQLLLPRGALRRLLRICSDMRLYDNRMCRKAPVSFNSAIELRPYQSPAVEAAKKHKQGVIVMPCGAGKTETALQIVAELQQPALWITHTKDLLQQSMSRAIAKLQLQPGEYGVIGSGEYSVGSKITFATVQTLANRQLEVLAWKFGAVIVDECHRAFMTSNKMTLFQRVIEQLPALYRIGITASEHRSDGLISGMYNMLGDKIYEVTQEDLNNNNHLVIPRVIAEPTKYTFSGDAALEFTGMITLMSRDEFRNEQIANTVLAMHRSGRHCLVLSDRLEQLEALRTKIQEGDPLASTEFVKGATGKKDRDAAFANIRNGKSDILFASYTLAKEGLDVPILDTLIMATPHRDKVAVQQSVGRIMRKHPNKTDAVVIDFVDVEIGICESQFRARKQVYKSLQCKIQDQPVRDRLKQINMRKKEVAV